MSIKLLPNNRVAANANGGALTDAPIGQGLDHFVGQRAAAREQPNVARLVNVAGIIQFWPRRG